MPHFSRVIIVATDRHVTPTVIAPPPISPVLVGDSFTIELQVLRRELRLESAVDGWRQGGSPRNRLPPRFDFLARTDRDGGWQVEAFWVAADGLMEPDGPVLDPTAHVQLPVLERFEPGLLSATFTCLRPGSFKGHFRGNLVESISIQLIGGPDDFAEFSGFGSTRIGELAWRGTCVAPEAPTPTPTSTPDPTATSDETIEVGVFTVAGQRVIFSQLLWSGLPDDNHCDLPHYHSFLPLLSIEGELVEDPDPDGCGFGTFDDLETAEIPFEDFLALEDFNSGR